MYAVFPYAGGFAKRAFVLAREEGFLFFAALERIPNAPNQKLREISMVRFPKYTKNLRIRRISRKLAFSRKEEGELCTQKFPQA